ncbi:hypothetical protein J2S19_004768 [Metabacillus malikii]|uniref:Tox-SHH domain-containing protein n=1 Tax=Metabacillus malikii TaxID=1504265 RepID=A0ABT9ZNQ8_9BACI|nr:hypothetical protein [Metabacillus malikii]
MRYPGPWQHLTYLRWNKHKDTLTTKYAEWKTAIDFTRKVITKEELDSLEGHIVDVVEIIDDYEGTVTGDYHVYDNGLIVRVYGGAYYEIVDSVPTVENSGNVKAQDSFFEDTPFEFVEYVVNPSTIVSKVVRKKIDDVTVGFVGKKGTKGIDKTVKPNDVVPYRPSNSPLENHHGVMDVWAKHNVPNYVSRGGNTPTLALTKEQHDATKAVYRQWLYEKTGKKVGGKIDWQSVSPREIQELTERMFDAANVPKSARQEYYNSFNKYNFRK